MSSRTSCTRRDRVVHALIAGLLCCGSTRSLWAEYVVTDLGVLVDVDEMDTSRPYAVNNNTQVAVTNRVAGAFRALRHSGTATNLGTLGGNESVAAGINIAGNVVGKSTDSAGDTRAFLWEPGGIAGPPTNPQMRSLGTLPSGAHSEATAINAAGQVVGYSQTGTGDDAVDHAFRWTAGTMTDLGAPTGFPYSYAYAINAAGNVVGEAYNAAFSRSIAFVHDGTIRTLGTLLGGRSSSALAINNQNQIVGYSDTAEGYQHAFLYDTQMHDLGTLGGLYSYARGINNAGEIVGGSFVDDTRYRAFIRQNGQMLDLNSMLDASAAGWILEEAYAISDRGHIVGTGLFGGQRRGFLLSPNNLPGDIDRDGMVDRADLARFVQFLGVQSNATWDSGDFNADGKTSLVDLAALRANFGQAMNGASPGAMVPEPSAIFTAISIALAAFAVASRARWRRVATSSVVILIHMAVAVNESQSADLYRITDLGLLTDAPKRTDSRPYAINASGQIALTNAPGGIYHAIRYDSSADAYLDLGTLGGDEALAFGINSAGQVVGRSMTDTGATRAFLWTSGGADGPANNPQMRDLGTLGQGQHSEAFAVNTAGQVVGYSDTAILPALNQQHAFLFSNGTMQDLGGLMGMPNSFAYGINAAGHVAGTAYNVSYAISKGFYFNGDRMRDIGNLGGLSTNAIAINDTDQIVGWSEVIAGEDLMVDHAFLYDGENMRDLGTLGGNFSYALGVNNQGAVVGGSFVDADDRNFHAFLYENGVMRDLNDLLGAADDWILEEARAVNESGLIVGVGSLADQPHGFLLTPHAKPLPGDINSDEQVDRRDVADFIAFFGTDAGAGWMQGDFDADGAVSLGDLVIQQSHLQSIPSPAAVPEPPLFCVVIFALAVACLVNFLRGFSNSGQQA